MSTLPTIVTDRSRLRLGIGAVVVLALLGLAVAVLAGMLGTHGSTTSFASSRPITTAVPSPTAAAAIYVHVTGAVATPGLYSLHDGDRVVDAIAAAGGFAADADQAGVNLARLLGDGEQLVVPVVGQAPVAAAGAPAGGKVNLNTADETALETLPRVGPAMAKRILDWRAKNGRFTAIEDLMSITGIGDKTFDALKDLITV